MAILHESGAIVARHVFRANTFLQQLRGLIGFPLQSGDALVLPGCRQVHSAFLKEPIHVAFCQPSNDGWQLLFVELLVPWRISHYVADSRLAIEMAADSSLIQLKPGDLLRWTEANLPPSA